MQMSQYRLLAQHVSLHQELGYTDEKVTKTQLVLGEAYLPVQSAFAECQFTYVGNGPENDAQESARAASGDPSSPHFLQVPV